jgi:hypothetical protein
MAVIDFSYFRPAVKSFVGISSSLGNQSDCVYREENYLIGFGLSALVFTMNYR